MSHLSSESDNETDQQPRDAAIFQMYRPEALSIAKIMLLAHSNRVPVKKRDMIPIVQKLIGSTKDYTRAEVSGFYNQARSFLRENFALTLIELPVVRLGLEHESPNRGELMLSSTVTGVRDMLLSNASTTQKRDWGLLCLLVMMIVLNGNGIAYAQLLESVKSTRLFEDQTDSEPSNMNETRGSDSQDSTTELLTSSLQRLLAQRYLERRVDTNNYSGPPAEESVNSENTSVIYYIGPYTKETLPANELKTMILRLYFPYEDIKSEAFLQQHEVLTKGLDLKLEASALRFLKSSQD